MRRLADQEGAVAVTVAVMLLALVGISMLAIDGGQLFTSRRNVIVDTDAAALAAARHMVTADCTAADQADAVDLALDVLDDNDSETTTPTPPAVTCTGGAGRATVTAVRTTDLSFGGLAGIPEVDVPATSVAQWGYVEQATGLRPIALCDKDPHFLEFARDANYLVDQDIIDMGGQELLDLVDDVAADPAEHLMTGRDGNAFPPGTVVHRVEFSRVVDTCGSAAGNWGWLDFDGGGGGRQQLLDRLLNGYDHPVTVGDNEDCAPELDPETDCQAETGAGGQSFDGTMTTIHCPSQKAAATCVAEQLAYPVVLFTSFACNGGTTGDDKGKDGDKGKGTPKGTCNDNGANAEYDHVAFVGIIIRDWSGITGNPNDVSWLGLEFVDPFLTSGTITGTPPVIGPGLISVQLCGGGNATTVDDYCVVP